MNQNGTKDVNPVFLDKNKISRNSKIKLNKKPN